MLEESKTPYIRKSDFTDIAKVGSGYGANTNTYAPPILQEGDSLLSQSMPIAIRIGMRTGFDQGVECCVKACQFMADASDFAEAATNASKSAETIKCFLKAPEEGKLSPCAEWLRNMENSIKGPYFYGARPTYVDFWFTQGFDWCDFVLFNPIGHKAEAHYPKIQGVLAGIRGLESAKTIKEPVGPPSMAMAEAVIADYKKAE